MGSKKYKVLLTQAERHDLEELISTGKAAAKKLTHARVLLKADQSPAAPGWSDAKISEALEISSRTIERIRQSFVEEGLETALNRRRFSKPRRKKFEGENESHLLALACSDPPEGRAEWSLRLLADKIVELEYLDSVSHETVRSALKKTTSSSV